MRADTLRSRREARRLFLRCLRELPKTRRERLVLSLSCFLDRGLRILAEGFNKTINLQRLHFSSSTAIHQNLPLAALALLGAVILP